MLELPRGPSKKPAVSMTGKHAHTGRDRKIEMARRNVAIMDIGNAFHASVHSQRDGGQYQRKSKNRG
jgi:hypothetical protein